MACIDRKHSKIISRNILSDKIYHWIDCIHIIWNTTSLFNPVSTHFISKILSLGQRALRKNECDGSDIHLHLAVLSEVFFFFSMSYTFLLGFASNSSFVFYKDIWRMFATSNVAKTAKLYYIFFFCSHLLSFLPIFFSTSHFWACTV